MVLIWIRQSHSMFIRHLRIAICLPIRHKLIQIRFRMTLMTLLDSTKTCSECTAIAKTYFRFFLFHFVRQEYACMNVSIFRPKLPYCLPHLVCRLDFVKLSAFGKNWDNLFMSRFMRYYLQIMTLPSHFASIILILKICIQIHINKAKAELIFS